MKELEYSMAYRCGWIDGRHGDLERFTENRRLAAWERAAERLDYYRGHRAGTDARQRSNLIVRAS